MFENLKGMAALAGLLKDLPRVKAKMEEVKSRLAGRTVEAESGGGAVRVTASGLLEVVAIEVDPVLLSSLVDPSNPEDRAVAQTLLAGAVNAALAGARKLAEQEMAAAAGEMGLPVPPGALEGLMR